MCTNECLDALLKQPKYDALVDAVREALRQMQGALNADDTGYPYEEKWALDKALADLDREEP